MKFYRIAAVLLALLMLFSFTACQNNDGGSGTQAPGSTAAPGTKAPDTKAPDTKAPDTKPADTTPAATTEAPVPTEPETEAPLAVDTISDAEMTILRLAMPQTLPDGSNFDILTRLMCCDKEEDYLIKGNSAGSTKFVSEADGAIYGNAIRFAAKADSKDSRAEITVQPATVRDVAGAKGILFYVDFSNVAIKEGTKMSASVTINTNDIRSQGPDKTEGSGTGYYYLDGVWTETHNIKSCRMEIPDNFKGWVYVPATSFTQSSDGLYWDSATGCFNDNFFVDNMRCYTDGYVYSADNWIIFDEITFVK